MLSSRLFHVPSRVLLDRELVVGFRAFVNQDQEYRSALQFDLPPWLASNQIENATLRLHYFDAWGSFQLRRMSWILTALLLPLVATVVALRRKKPAR